MEFLESPEWKFLKVRFQKELDAKVNDLLASTDMARIHYLRGYIAALKRFLSIEASAMIAEEKKNAQR